MGADARNTSLRMIPYGNHVLTADDGVILGIMDLGDSVFYGG